MIDKNENLAKAHKLISLMGIKDFWFNQDELRFSWDERPSFAKNDWHWDFQLSFPDLETMMTYINQQIEIHEQFLARFSE